MLLQLSLLIAQVPTQFIPPLWQDMPKRVKELVAELRLPRAVGNEMTSFSAPRCRVAAGELLVIGKPAISALVKALDLKEEFQLTNTIDVLGAAKAVEAVPKLMGLVKNSPSTDVVVAAIRALGQIQDKRAIPLLVETLNRSAYDDKPGKFAAEAACALAEFKDPKSLPPIADLIQHDDVVGLWENGQPLFLGTDVAINLAKLGKQAVPAVSGYLDSPFKKAMLRAALCLAITGDRSGEQLLLDNIDDPIDREYGDHIEDALAGLKDSALAPWAIARLEKKPKDSIALHILSSLPASVAGEALTAHVVTAAEQAVGDDKQRFTDPGYGPIFQKTLEGLTGRDRAKFFHSISQIALPANTQLFRDEFAKEQSRDGAWALSKLDPQFLMDWMQKGTPRRGHFSEAALALNYKGFRDYLFTHRTDYQPDEFVRYIATIGDPRDEELLLQNLHNARLRQSALYGLLKMKKIDYSLSWPDEVS